MASGSLRLPDVIDAHLVYIGHKGINGVAGRGTDHLNRNAPSVREPIARGWHLVPAQEKTNRTL
jgi:hypothetical protein